MSRRLYLVPVVFVLFLVNGCIKESYDMAKLSEKMQLSPTLIIPAFTGSATFSDLVESDDTILFDNDKSVKLVFRKDSVISLVLEDFYDLSDMVSFSESYTIGELTLAPFQGTMGFTLGEISSHFSESLRDQFAALDDGTAHQAPPFPSTSLGSRSFSAFTNFQTAVFSSGFLDISVTNNLPAGLNSIEISLSSSLGPVGTPLTIPPVAPGQTQTVSINLAGRTLTNTITASVTLQGSPGSSSLSNISLTNNNIQFSVSSRNLIISSGRVILPAQVISSIGSDTVAFDAGQGIELEQMRIITGNLSWRVSSTSTLDASMDITFPTALSNGVPVNELIRINPVTLTNGSISINNTIIDLDADISEPFNKIPVVYSLSVTSNNTLVNFNSTERVSLELRLIDPGLDFVKGYFGQEVQTIDYQSLDFGIGEYLDNISGDFLFTDPTVRINYSNSFALPIQVALNGRGTRGSETIDLGLSPFTIAWPDAPANRDITASFTIDKDNSSLPELISMPPELINFSGSAKMNPAGDLNHLRNNYLFGNSRFIGSVEVEIPLLMSVENLMFADTTNNFLSDLFDGGIEPEDLQLLELTVKAANGFPLDVSLKVSLYDSATGTVSSTIDAPGILEAAPVNNEGRVTGKTETSTTIKISRVFLNNINNADRIIFSFKINTRGNDDVRIFSDYRIDFSAAITVSPDIDPKSL